MVLVRADGRRLRAEALRIEADSVSWIDPTSRLVGRATTVTLRGVIVDGGRPRGVIEGAPVCVEADGDVLVGRLVAADSLGLLVVRTPEADRAVERAVWERVPASGRGALVGGLLGGGSALALNAAWCQIDCNRPAGAASGAVVGALVGAAWGGLRGRWVRRSL